MNIAGRRVTAPTLERVLTEHPAVGEAAVVYVPHGSKGEVPVGFVTLSGEGSDEVRVSEAAADLVEADLGRPFRPTAVHVFPGIPRTQTGKIPRGLLWEVYLVAPPDSVSTLEQGDVLNRFPEREDDE